MSRGVLYVMTTVVKGLVKIGKTDDFENRMYILERNGYANVAGLKRKFAIEVDDYDEKEILLHTIFNKSNVVGTELFAIDEKIVVQLLSSFEGTVIYPKIEGKDIIFDESTNQIKKNTKCKAKKFKFSMVDIPIGTELVYVKDLSVKVTVIDETHVLYKGQKWSMSKLVRELGHLSTQVQGTKYFTYNGKKLTDLRNEKERKLNATT